MIINFKCMNCGSEFDCEIGTVCFKAEAARPTFEKDVVCPRCIILDIESDQVELMEEGQTQLTNFQLMEEAIDLYEN